MTTCHNRTLPRLPPALLLLLTLALASACGDATSVGTIDYVVVHDDPGASTSRSGGYTEAWIGPWIASVGDVDGNGITDLVAQGVSTNSGLGGTTGYELVYLGDGGQILATTPLEILVDEYRILREWDGNVLTAIGDLNGDGIKEIAIHGERFGGTSFHEGLIVYFLNASGEITSTGFVDFGLIDGFDAYSERIIVRNAAPAGDINGDGVPDLAVTTAPLISENKAGSRVWVAFMASDGHVTEWHAINARVPNRLLPDVATAGTPLGITGVGDVDGDGVPDLAIGDSSMIPCFLATPHQWSPRSGDVTIVLMNRDGSVKCVRRLFPGLQEDRPAGLFGTRIGNNLRDLGDLDGDGIHELLVHAYLGYEEYARQGFWIVYLGVGGSAKHTERVDADAFGGEEVFSSWGPDIGSAALGDISGNGEVWFGIVNSISRFADTPEGALRGRLWLAKLADRRGQFPPASNTDALGECSVPEPDEYELSPPRGAADVSFSVASAHPLTALQFAFSYRPDLGTFNESDGSIECIEMQSTSVIDVSFGVNGRPADIDGSTCKRFQYAADKPERFVVDVGFNTPTGGTFQPATCRFLVRGESVDADAFILDYVEAYHDQIPIPHVVVSISDVVDVP